MVPNALYPDDIDPMVSQFLPTGLGLATYNLQIYDTWGNLLWENSELVDGRPVTGWRGKDMKGNDLPFDVYTWKIEAKFLNGKRWLGMVDKKGKKRPQPSGTITLIR